MYPLENITSLEEAFSDGSIAEASSAELALLTSIALLTDPHDRFADRDGYVKWRLGGLIARLYPSRYLTALCADVDFAKHVSEMSRKAGLHVTTPSGLLRLTPPEAVLEFVETKKQSDDPTLCAIHTGLAAALERDAVNPLLLLPSSDTEGEPQRVTDKRCCRYIRSCTGIRPAQRQLLVWLGRASADYVSLTLRLTMIAPQSRHRIVGVILGRQCAGDVAKGSQRENDLLADYLATGIALEDSKMISQIVCSPDLKTLVTSLMRMSAERRRIIAILLE